VNNLAYNSQDAAYVGPKVEEKVREELGASTPFSYQVETGEAETATLGSVLCFAHLAGLRVAVTWR